MLESARRSVLYVEVLLYLYRSDSASGRASALPTYERLPHSCCWFRWNDHLSRMHHSECVSRHTDRSSGERWDL